MSVRDRDKSHEGRAGTAPPSPLSEDGPGRDADLRAARLRIQQRLAEWRGEVRERVVEIDSHLERTAPDAGTALLDRPVEAPPTPAPEPPITETSEALPVDDLTTWMPPVEAPAAEAPAIEAPLTPEPLPSPPVRRERAPSELVERRGLRERIEEAPAIGVAIPVGAALSLLAAAAYVWLAVSEGGNYATSYAATGLVVWWMVVLSLVLRIWPPRGVPRSTAAAGALLAGFAVLAVLSTIWAEDGGRAFAEAVRAVSYLGVFVLAAIIARTGHARDLLGGLAIGLAVLATLALASRLQPGLVGSETELQQVLPEAAGRLSYPILYWNGLAACMALVICLFTWLGADARTRLGRALAVAALPLPTLVIYLTGSRGGGIAAIAGLVGLLALAPHRWRTLAVVALGTAGSVVLLALAAGSEELVRGLDTSGAAADGDRLTIAVIAVAAVLGLLAYRWDSLLERLSPARLGIPAPLAAGAVILAVLAANYAIEPGEQLKERRAGSELSARVEPVDDEQITASTTSGRIEYWQSAVDGFETAPVVGLGAGEFETWWRENGPLAQRVTNAHSLFVETLAELGIVGVVLIIGFLGVAAIAGFRRTLDLRRQDRRDPAVGVGAAALALLLAGVVSAAGEWTWELPAAFAPVVVAAAVLCTPAAAAGRRARTPGGPVRLGIMLIVSALAIGATGVLYLSELRLDQSGIALDEGDHQLAIERAESASDLQPWDAQPYTQLALIERDRGRPEAAKDATLEAIERSPDDWQLWFLLAHINYRLGDYPGEHDALARARELAPRAPAALFVSPGPRTPATPPGSEGEN